MSSMDFSGSNMGMRSQMVGVPGAATQGRQVQKQDETQKGYEQQQAKQEPQKDPKDVFVREDRTGGQQELPKTHQKKTQEVLQHFLSHTDGKKTAETQQKQNLQDTNKTDKERAKEQTGESGEGQQQQSVDLSEANFAPVDNASRIGLMYQQATRKKKSKGASGRFDTNGGQQQQSLKNFLSNLRSYVNLEYKQYTKSELSLYSRRNLREILSALGEEVKAFDNKSAKDRWERQNGYADMKKYNNFYAARASKQLKLFNEDPMEDPNYSPFEMIA